MASARSVQVARQLLVVDDDDGVRDSLRDLLARAGYDVVVAASGAEGLRQLDAQPVDLILTDVNMPGMDGVEMLEQARQRCPHVGAIVLTAYGTIDTAVRAMKLGAFDYIRKPFHVDELLMTVARALELSQLRTENASLRRTLRAEYGLGEMVGGSAAAQRLYRMLERIADTDSTVLITGESGTGKELVARTLHYNSRRRDGPLVPINCGAIPEHLLESELFGHEKGAFTGASSARVGRFEAAHGGTLFLDEIGEMHASLQVKLLRVLQEREFERVGGNRTIRTDVRLVAATNQDLEARVADGKFREDLYYRLNVIPVEVPPLRKRADDVPMLVQHFLERMATDKGLDVPTFSDGAMALLMAYEWPGNIRELENLVERMVVLEGPGEIGPGALPEHIGRRNMAAALGRVVLPDDGLNFDETVSEFEEALIVQALDRSKWVKNRAAQLLGLNRTTLVEKIKKKRLEARYHPQMGQTSAPQAPLTRTAGASLPH